MNFEPLAEFIVEDGGWLDITLISDSPLLEHDAMYMLQHYDKARQRLLEIRARDERRLKLAREQGMSSDEIAELERQAAEAKEKLESEKPEEVEKPTNKKAAPKKKTDSSTMMSFEDSDDDDDLF